MEENLSTKNFISLSPFNFKVGDSLYNYYSQKDLAQVESRVLTEEETSHLDEKYRKNYTMYRFTKTNFEDTYISTFGENRKIFYCEFEKVYNNSQLAIIEAINIWEKFDKIFETISRIEQIEVAKEADITKKNNKHFSASKTYFDPNFLRIAKYLVCSDNSKGKLIESVKINTQKEILKTSKDFGPLHRIEIKVESNILKRETQLILGEIEKSGSFENIIDQLKGHKTFNKDKVIYKF